MNYVANQPKKRIESIDILRGIVMVIMALDHIRDFLTNLNYDPTDLTKASTALFLTRFITHYCAATFVFLAGTGAFLSLNRGKSKNEATKFLFSRGLWLVFLELTIIRFGWFLNFDYSFIFLQVFWALGCSMMVLSLLVYLPLPLIGAFGLLLILGHNLFDAVSPRQFGPAGGVLWQFLHVSSIVKYGDHNQIFAFYPLIPWIGVMAAGYAFGTIFKSDPQQRKKTLLTIGFSAIALFIVIRYFNLYGDPAHWKSQDLWYRTVLSFINVQKYPPSLDYLLITLGPAFLALAALEGIKNKVTDVFLVFGRVPLFYYLMHLYLMRLLAAITYGLARLLHGPANGFNLPVVYAVWLLGVFILYFPCKWFMMIKMQNKSWWLSYL